MSKLYEEALFGNIAASGIPNALAQAGLEEMNNTRTKLADVITNIQAATDFADLKARFAAIAPLPQITTTEMIANVQNKLPQ